MGAALDHVRQQLLPFRWGQWWRLAVLGIVTAEISGGGCQSSFGRSDSATVARTLERTWLPWDQMNFATIVALAMAVVLVVFAVLFVALYINSVCRFVLLDALVQRHCGGLRAGWAKWRRIGRVYLRWQILYHSVLGAGLGVVLLLPLAWAYAAGWLDTPQDHLWSLAGIAILMVVGLVILAVPAIVVYVIAKDFLAPILAIDDVPVREGWDRLRGIMRADRSGFTGYLALKLVLSIVTAMVFFVIAFVLILPVLISAVAENAGVGPDLGAAASGAMVVGVGVLSIGISFALGVPITVFFPASGLYFLASRYPPLAAWLDRTTDEGRTRLN